MSDETINTAPIAKLTIGTDYEISKASLYTPGLPPGEHDVYCEPVNTDEELKRLRARVAELEADNQRITAAYNAKHDELVNEEVGLRQLSAHIIELEEQFEKMDGDLKELAELARLKIGHGQ